MKVACEMLSAMRGQQPRPVRLIGVSVGSLTDDNVAKQLDLFESAEQRTARKTVDTVVDDVANKLGAAAVYRATSHRWKVKGDR